MTTALSQAKEIFDGVMLSDAGIYYSGPRSTIPYFKIGLSPESVDWLESIKEALTLLGINIRNKYPQIRNSISKGKPYLYSHLISDASPILKIEHSRWYINRIKIVPKDITITPVLLANWYMGDGSNHRSTSGHRQLRFSTEGFTESEVDFLINQLVLREIPAHKYQSGKGFIISIQEFDEVNQLLNTMKPFILPSFNYKLPLSEHTPLIVITDKLGRTRLNRRIYDNA